MLHPLQWCVPTTYTYVNTCIIWRGGGRGSEGRVFGLGLVLVLDLFVSEN